MRKWLLAVFLSLGFAAAAQAETLGECAWAQISTADKQAVLDGYKAGMDSGAKALQSRDGSMQAAVITCAKRTDVPKSWAQGLMASQAIQASAANELMLAKNIQRDALDATWRGAPEAARQCVRANAAKVYGLMNELCPDPKAPLWLLDNLKVSTVTDRAAAVQTLYYFNAKAQTEWAEALIAKFQTRTPKSGF